jgi:hypothetical protein
MGERTELRGRWFSERHYIKRLEIDTFTAVKVQSHCPLIFVEKELTIKPAVERKPNTSSLKV